MPCGTTGESVSLSHAEYAQVVRVVVEQARGRVPVVPGAGTASTRHTLELADAAKSQRVDGLLIVAPYYNRPSQDGLFAHYKSVAEHTGLPIVLYNIPGRTGVDVSLATLERLAAVPQILAVKEATGSVARSADVVAQLGARYSVLSGDDALTLPIMAVGGKGVVSVASNAAPAEVARQVDLHLAGDVRGALTQAQRLRKLYEALFLESSPGPVKLALALQGRIAREIRLPLVLPSEATEARVRQVLAELSLL
jgi:4-hydroxy-tetrahydrodipicolinate synthase